MTRRDLILSKKRKRSAEPAEEEVLNLDDLDLGSLFGGMASKRLFGGSDNVYSHHNRVFFNDDITMESMSSLCRELRQTEERVMTLSRSFGLAEDAIPIILHITSYGGSLHAVFMAIDAIKALRVPVHTVVEGYAASAGTLLSVSGAKRYIAPNACMLIHELRSSTWGKMSEIEEEFTNLKKMMRQIIRHYVEHTHMEKKELKEILKHDLDWDASECLAKGLVDVVGYP